MKKLLVLLFTFLTLSGCGQTVSINDIPFNMKFEELNIDNSTAKFIVEGLPNDEEFTQIPQVIVDSLNAQEIDDDKEITVTVTSPSVSSTVLEYGTCKYKNGALTENHLVNIDEETYKSLIG